MTPIAVGSTVVDKITGFRGIVTGRVEYLSGCNQVLVAPKVKADGGFLEGHWFDEQRVDVDQDERVVTLDNGDAPGFDQPAPIR